MFSEQTAVQYSRTQSSVISHLIFFDMRSAPESSDVMLR